MKSAFIFLATAFAFNTGLAASGQWTPGMDDDAGKAAVTSRADLPAADFTGMRHIYASVKSAGGGMTAEKLNAIVEAAKNTGEWIVFMTHGIARGYDAWENPEELRRHLDWVKGQKDVRVLTFADAAKARTDAAKASAEQLSKYYPRDFKSMVEAVRAEIGDVPVIAGEIGRWMRKDGDHAAKINPVIDALPKTVPNCAVASSEGLKNQDAHHFDRASQRVLATRYYEEFKKCAVR